MSIPDVQTSGEKEDYQANDGVTAIYGSDDAKKPGQAYSMIKIASSKVVVKGGALQVSVWIQPASSGSFTYDAIYVGNRNDETKEPIILGEVDTEKNLEKFTFTVPLEKAGGEVSFVPRNGRTQKWSTSSSLAFKLPAMDDFVKPSEINITTQPKQETEAGSGSSVALSVEASGEEGINLNYRWQFSADGATWADCTGVTAKTATYTFTMSLETAGKYRCIVSDATGTGYQMVQSLYAIGSGGLFGVGLGNSKQKYLYIPEPQNDFIFAIVAEELGFVGCVTIILLFAIFVWRGIVISMKAPDMFGSLLAIGVTTLVATQAIINIAVVTASIPTTGMALPFFSYRRNRTVSTTGWSGNFA